MLKGTQHLGTGRSEGVVTQLTLQLHLWYMCFASLPYLKDFFPQIKIFYFKHLFVFIFHYIKKRKQHEVQYQINSGQRNLSLWQWILIP
jgi:hypothetical protein